MLVIILFSHRISLSFEKCLFTIWAKKKQKPPRKSHVNVKINIQYQSRIDIFQAMNAYRNFVQRYLNRNLCQFYVTHICNGLSNIKKVNVTSKSASIQIQKNLSQTIFFSELFQHVSRNFLSPPSTENDMFFFVFFFSGL